MVVGRDLRGPSAPSGPVPQPFPYFYVFGRREKYLFSKYLLMQIWLWTTPLLHKDMMYDKSTCAAVIQTPCFFEWFIVIPMGFWSLNNLLEEYVGYL